MTSDKPTKPGEAIAPRTAAGAPVAARDAAQQPAFRSSNAEIADFVARVRELPATTAQGRGRLIFAMDATLSREPTWDMALGLQADMFTAVKTVGGLDVQLVYFRGGGECRASSWVCDPGALSDLMSTVACRGGYTQIGKVLTHARLETETRKVNALVYVGDAMEEAVDDLCGRAGELALHGCPAFLFQEGDDQAAERAFKEIARLTGGAWCRFDTGAAAQLRELLTAVAVYASGGRSALQRLADTSRGSGAQRLISQMRR